MNQLYMDKSSRSSNQQYKSNSKNIERTSKKVLNSNNKSSFIVIKKQERVEKQLTNVIVKSIVDKDKTHYQISILIQVLSQNHFLNLI